MVYTKDNGDKVDEIMKKFGEYCGVYFTYVFDNCYIYTEINLGILAIDFRNFVELETGYYITDSDWINTGIFTWEKLVKHLNKGMKKGEGVLASFKIDANGSLSIPAGKSSEELIKYICDYADATKSYNPVKNISIEKYYRCAKGAPSQCDQFYSGNGILFMSESDCGKYYYWEDYNSRNELIFFRGEKSWVEDNYVKVTNKDTTVLWEERKLGVEEEFVETVSVPEADDLIKTNTANTWTDKHYDFTYTLTEGDIESGKIKIDPYFVAYQWKLGKKDDSGALWHCFKNIARFGEKNTVEREIKALHAQIKRLAELNGVTL